MATINGYTKEKLDEIVAAATKSMAVVGGHLIVTREDDSTFDAGSVVGPVGPTGPPSEEIPIGAMNLFGGTAAPTNWLLCDGSAVSRATYADLFAVLGTSYGVGNGSTTFNLPDMRGRVPVGLKSSDTDFNVLGKVGGAKSKLLTAAEIPAHTHALTAHSHGGSAGGESGHSHALQGALTAGSSQYSPAFILNDSAAVVFQPDGSSTHTPRAGGVGSSGGHNHPISADGGGATSSVGGSTAYDTMNPYVAVNYIIKAL